MNILFNVWRDHPNVTRECVPCQVCGIPTTMLGTKLCNGCWEVKSRLMSFLRCPNAIQFVQTALIEAVAKG